MSVVEVVLDPVAPYDFSQALGYLRRSPATVLEEIGPDWYRRALSFDGRDVLVTIRSFGTLYEPRLRVELATCDEVDKNITDQVVQRLNVAFSLQSDPSEFLRLAKRDPVLARVVEAFPGVRPILIPDPYEALIWAILGQQINVAFARKLKTTLIDLVGRSFQTYPVMPLPEQVAGIDPEVLKRNQFSRQKIEYVLDTSGAIARGDLNLAALGRLGPDKAIAELTRFRGIGRWTAEYLLMRAFGSPDSIPAADLGLRAVVGRAYGLDRHATEVEVRKLAESWKPYRGWAAFYWWTALQAGLAEQTHLKPGAAGSRTA